MIHFLEKKVIKFIHINFPIYHSFGIAVSGGVDSMVLLYILNKFFNNNLNKLEVIHCNFNLRNKSSYDDAIFVKNFCIKNNIICHIREFNTKYYSKKNKLSIQIAARNLRYNWFNELFYKKSYQYIALGHNLDDSIETFIINLIRGSGIKGLLGIPKKRNKFIRPLSFCKKKDIINYAITKNISWRSDISNFDIKYLRNKIRKKIYYICNSSFSDLLYKGFTKTIKFLNLENGFIEENIKSIYDNITIIRKNNPLFWKIDQRKIIDILSISIVLYRLFSPYGFCNISILKKFIYSQSGKQLISDKYRIIKNRNYWIVTSNNNFKKNRNKFFYVYNLHNNYNINNDFILKFKIINKHFKEIKNFKKNIFVDLDKIHFPLLLRTWKNGDFIFPIGIIGRKKISKYYKDIKLSLLEKEHTWLLINGDGNIISVIKYLLDKRFIVTYKTQKILEIIIIKNT